MKYGLFLILFIFFASCTSTSKTIERPKDLIEKEKMVQLTTKLMLMDAHIQLSYGELSKFHKILNASNGAILKESKISKDQYDRSFAYYASNQTLLDEIYQGVLQELKKEENR